MNDSLDALACAAQILSKLGLVMSGPKEIVPAWKKMRDEQQAQTEYETR